MIYFIQDESTLLIKIGFTEHNPENRLRSLQTGSAGRLILLFVFTRGSRDYEKRIHSCYCDARVNGEWFRPVPGILRLICNLSKMDAGFEMLEEWARQSSDAQLDGAIAEIESWEKT